MQDFLSLSVPKPEIPAKGKPRVLDLGTVVRLRRNHDGSGIYMVALVTPGGPDRILVNLECGTLWQDKSFPTDQITDQFVEDHGGEVLARRIEISS